MQNLILILCVFLFTTAKGQSDSTTVAKIDGETYKSIFSWTKGTVSIVNHKGKVVLLLKPKQLFDTDFLEVEFRDFDGDGYKDLLIGYSSDMPYIYDLALYDKRSRKFIQVKQFPEYPAPISLKGTNLFYSYHHSGCADYNWDSDLFKIVNFRIVKIGNISGKDCVDPPEEPGIYITKVNGKNNLLIKKYPLAEIDNFKDWKWGFIAWYWQHHYKKFTASN